MSAMCVIQFAQQANSVSLRTWTGLHTYKRCLATAFCGFFQCIVVVICVVVKFFICSDAFSVLHMYYYWYTRPPEAR